MSREEIIAKIKGIAENEKFKIDAFLFCGFPSGKPNQELMKACEKFVEADEAGKADETAANALIAEMEAALKAESDVAEKDNITSSNEPKFGLFSAVVVARETNTQWGVRRNNEPRLAVVASVRWVFPASFCRQQPSNVPPSFLSHLVVSLSLSRV